MRQRGEEEEPDVERGQVLELLREHAELADAGRGHGQEEGEEEEEEDVFVRDASDACNAGLALQVKM